MLGGGEEMPDNCKNLLHLFIQATPPPGEYPAMNLPMNGVKRIGRKFEVDLAGLKWQRMS